jgi:hypothetical protein
LGVIDKALREIARLCHFMTYESPLLLANRSPVDTEPRFRGKLKAILAGFRRVFRGGMRAELPPGPFQMIGWLVALVYNAVGDFASALAGDFVGCHVRTLRRMFFNRPGALYETPEAMVVCLDRFAGQQALVPVIDAFNAAGHRLPWLENRQVVVSLTPDGQPRSGP